MKSLDIQKEIWYSTTKQIFSFKTDQYDHSYHYSNAQLLVGPQRGEEVAKLQIIMAIMLDCWTLLAGTQE